MFSIFKSKPKDKPTEKQPTAPVKVSQPVQVINGWDNLVAQYRNDSRPIHLKIASLAQWILESGRGQSQLAKSFLNYGGIKYRPELAPYATPVSYNAHDGNDQYCAFKTDVDFINGYWAFMARSPYKGWEQNSKTAEEYIRYIGKTYATAPTYIEKVIQCFPEAAKLLGADAVRVPRQDKEGKPIFSEPTPGNGKFVIPDYKNNSNVPHIYPLNTRYEADPDMGGVLPLGKPDTIVLHHTVSYNVDGTISWFKKDGVDIHFIIGHNGEIVQMVPCNHSAAHAGTSKWNGIVGLNSHSVGIEVVNLGPLTKTADGYIDAYGRKYNGEVRERNVFGYKYWEPFTPAQEKAVTEICIWLMKTYGIPVDNICGHYECSPGIKIDPAGGFSQGSCADYREYLKSIVGAP